MKGDRRYVLLKKALKRKGLTPYSYLAQVMGIKLRTLENKMQGRIPWKMNEMYQLLNLLGQPPWRLCIFFPETDIKKPPVAADGKRGKTA